ncbi:molybdenum cofactor guanylyltransferase MobA [Helicobacter sp. 11S02596-1]|uniref:molybdenum cofactor guanylyltransferase MobA n=1 Tax=Helicobacter sp. 11S02596-1 TaxID=1476194 RepID=UPI000BA761EF|nr:molybdenum cofactor guanylyltransferase MobA [Helicobacter sp. 11S02596-1]PAF44713.1 hypothetical protein BJI48_01600 [Helicobacter sp. 11S02596-1]
MKLTLPCVLLAGGKSSRMGRNKANLIFGDMTGEKLLKESLLSYQYKKMCQIFERVFISCKAGANFDLEADFLVETSELFSPLVGIENAFCALDVPKIFFLSVDTPFLKESTIRALCALSGDYDVVCPENSARAHYLMGVWDKRMGGNIKEAIKNAHYQVGSVVRASHFLCVEFEDEKEFCNLNTPEDYQEALAYLRRDNG